MRLDFLFLLFSWKYLKSGLILPLFPFLANFFGPYMVNFLYLRMLLEVLTNFPKIFLCF